MKKLEKLNKDELVKLRQNIDDILNDKQKHDLKSYLVYLKGEINTLNKPVTIKQKAHYRVILEMLDAAYPLNETKLDMLYKTIVNYR